MKRWQGCIYNEFRGAWIRWHDYVSIIIHGFPILLIRRYDWLEKETSTFTVLFCGFSLGKLE